MDFYGAIAIDTRAMNVQNETGLGFCHGKKYFCRDSGKNRLKPAKTGKNSGKNLYFVGLLELRIHNF